MKFKDILVETLEENSWKGNYIRIYPSKGSENYDKYFSGPRPYNKFLHKCLYTNEIIPLQLNEYKAEPEENNQTEVSAAANTRGSVTNSFVG